MGSTSIIITFTIGLTMVSFVWRLLIERLHYNFFFFFLTLQHACSDTQAVMQIEWLHNGTVVRTGTDDRLTLTIDSVQPRDAGVYSCQATLSDGTMLGPVNAGQLRVFGKYTCMYLKLINNLYMQVYNFVP